MNVIGLTILAISTWAAPDDPTSSGEFVNLMKDLHRETRSVCFIFEGEMEIVGREGSAKPEDQPISYQGLYALRVGAKQAGLLEYYESRSSKPPFHRSLSLLNDVKEASDRLAISEVIDPRTKKPFKSFGGPGALHDSPSPEWFSYSWFFSVYQFTVNPQMPFENLGWDDIAGHRCLKVKLATLPLVAPSNSHNICWIDLERGGHPLQVETYFDGKLLQRVDEIVLEKVPDTSGKPLWFPVKGTVNVYGSLSGHFRITQRHATLTGWSWDRSS